MPNSSQTSPQDALREGPGPSWFTWGFMISLMCVRVCRYSMEESRLQLLSRVLEWGHLAPTAPDTLSTYPFSDTDPFVLDTAPHVFFAGNQPDFQSRVMTGGGSS